MKLLYAIRADEIDGAAAFPVEAVLGHCSACAAPVWLTFIHGVHACDALPVCRRCIRVAAALQINAAGQLNLLTDESLAEAARWGMLSHDPD